MGNNSTSTTLSRASALANGVWTFYVAYHDSVNNLLGLSINGGAYTTTACTHGSYDSANRFSLSDVSDDSQEYFGAQDEVGIFKGAPPSEDAVAWLYNSGAGRTYEDL